MSRPKVLEIKKRLIGSLLFYASNDLANRFNLQRTEEELQIASIGVRLNTMSQTKVEAAARIGQVLNSYQV